MSSHANGNAGGEPLTKSDYQSLAAFRFALRRFMHFSTQAAQEAGLTTSQHQALLSIKGHPAAGPMTVGQLAEHLVVAPHTAAELVSRLQEYGMLRKVSDPTDRRRVGLQLTAKAERALCHLTNIHLQEVRILAPGLIETLQGLLLDEVKPRLKRAI